jgi:hypothetical protein
MTASTIAAEPRSLSSGAPRVRRRRERRRQGLRLLTVPAAEPAIDAAVERGLLKPEDRVEPWTVVQACYAGSLSDKALNWLVSGRVIAPEQRGAGPGDSGPRARSPRRPSAARCRRLGMTPRSQALMIAFKLTVAARSHRDVCFRKPATSLSVTEDFALPNRAVT